MTDDQYATRRELDMVRDDIRAIRSQLQDFDAGIGRGVPVLQDRLLELVKDMTELRTEMTTKFAGHLQDHKDAQRERVSGRRWLIGTVFVALGALGGLYAILIDLLSRIHH